MDIYECDPTKLVEPVDHCRVACSLLFSFFRLHLVRHDDDHDDDHVFATFLLPEESVLMILFLCVCNPF